MPGDHLNQPLVTTIIPAYNAASTLGRAIISALAQTYTALEVVIVDDGSQDQTAKVASAFNDKRVRLIRLPRNRGESAALNEGIAVAQGEFIAFLDADDEWLPTKLEVQIPFLLGNPRATMVTCGARWIDRFGNVTLDWGFPPKDVRKGDVWRALLAATYVTKPCVVARRSALRDVGPFDTRLLVAEDQDMWIRLAMAGDVEFVSDLLTLVHDTPGSLTKIHADKEDRYILPMVRRHIEERRLDLSKREIRRILGERYSAVGRNLYARGTLLRGAVLLLKAILHGTNVGANLRFLVMASPPIRAAKGIILSRTR